MQEQTNPHNPDWPPGVYRGEDGRLYRDRVRPVSVETDPETGELLETHEYLPTEVMLPTATDSAGILAQQRRAKMSGLDFWKPGIGWLRRGVRREVDRPENRGDVATPRRRETRRVAPAPPPPAATAATSPSPDPAIRARRGAVIAPEEAP